MIKHHNKHTCNSAIYYKSDSKVIAEPINFTYIPDLHPYATILDKGDQTCNSAIYYKTDSKVIAETINFTYISDLHPYATILDKGDQTVLSNLPKK